MFHHQRHAFHHALHHALHHARHQRAQPHDPQHGAHSDQHGHGAHAHGAQGDAAWDSLWHGIGRGGRGAPIGRGRGGIPGGSFGGFGGGDEGDDGFARGRKFSADDLQLLLLDLINSEPSYGYELIKALQTRSNGFYSPSPGMIYPALTYLEELGYAVVQLEANRKCYTLADAGREYLTANRERVDHLNAKLTHIAQRVEMMRRAMAGEEPLDPNAGGLLPEFHAARHDLRTALHRIMSADEQRRVTAIIARATAEIMAGQADTQDK